jgi:methylaspartate mutase sigma subunit
VRSLPANNDNGLRVLLSSTASDSHTWNLVYLSLLLEEHGHTVHNLGACTPDDRLIGECRDHTPDLVVLSTVNGHGYQDGARIARLFAELPQAPRPALVIGGKLGLAGPEPERRNALLAAGFTAVFDGAEDDIERFLALADSLRTPAASLVPLAPAAPAAPAAPVTA